METIDPKKRDQWLLEPRATDAMEFRDGYFKAFGRILIFTTAREKTSRLTDSSDE